MAKSAPAFNAFTSGELSEKMEGRTDLEKYFTGARQMKNLLVHPHGGVSRRPGTIFVKEVKSSANATRLIPFEFNVAQTYILEFGNNYIRFYRDGGIIVDGGNSIVETVTTYTTAQLPDIKFVQSADVMYIVHPDHPVRKLTRTSHIDWILSEVNFKNGPMMDPNITQTTMRASSRTGTPYVYASDVVGINDDAGFKSTDVGRLIKLHDGYTKITAIITTTLSSGISNTDTTLNIASNTGFQTDSPGGYFQIGDEIIKYTSISGNSVNSGVQRGQLGTTATAHNSGATVTSLTSVATTVQENEEYRTELMPYVSNTKISAVEGDPSSTGLEHNDRYVNSEKNFVTEGLKTGMSVEVAGFSTAQNNATIGNSTNPEKLIVQATEDTLLLAPSDDVTNEASGQAVSIQGALIDDENWSLGAFSSTTGYPRAIAFYEERLVLAGTLSNPQTLFFSKGGDFENFATGVNADDGLIYTIGSNQVNVIRYLSSSSSLLVGTSGGEFAVRSSGSDAPLSPTSAQIKRQAYYGTSNVDPIQVGNVTLFVQRARRKVRELVYSFDTDSYTAPDLTIMAEHITSSGIKEMAHAQEPDNTIWCVLNNGKLACMTYRREENIVAWHEHTLGGSWTDTSVSPNVTYDYGVVESIATIPGELDEDEIYVVVKRTVNGATKRFVERFNFFDFGTDVKDAFYVDSGLSSYTNSAFTTFSGLGHLEGQTLSVLADGATHPDVTVSSGQVTLDRSAKVVHFGLKYTSTLQTMRVDAGATLGTSQGKTKRIYDVTVRLFRTVGLKIGQSPSVIDLIPFRSSADQMDEALDLFTGDKTIEFTSGYDSDGYIYAISDQPLPMTILSVFPRLQTFER